MAGHRFEVEVEVDDGHLFVVVPDSVIAELGPRRRPPVVVEVDALELDEQPRRPRERSVKILRPGPKDT